MKQKHITKGFTLIEVLLSLTIFSILISGSSFLLLESLQIRASVESVAEIDFQGTQILHVITEQIRNADSISSLSPEQILHLLPSQTTCKIVFLLYLGHHS